MSPTFLPGAAPRVVKLGGSLLDFDNLRPALNNWLAEVRGPFPIVFLAGGGELADAIRRADARHGLGEEASHWLCIRLLGVTARMLAGMLPETEFVDDFGNLQRRLAEPSAATMVFDPGPFLATAELHLPGCRLPRTWQVTTDSIAARLAEVLAADLVLLKSSPPPDAAVDAQDRFRYFTELARRDYVDSHFPWAAEAVGKVEMVNLRVWGNRQPPREIHGNRA